MWRRTDPARALPLAAWPLQRSKNWLERVNGKLDQEQLDTLRTCAQRGRPLARRDGFGPRPRGWDWNSPSAAPAARVRTAIISDVPFSYPAGNVQYVGITNDLERRAAEHLARKGIAIDAIPGLTELSRFDARAVEQVLIKRRGLANLLNKINSIATSNPIYPEAIERGLEILNLLNL
jgi:filamentous hemagglutinin